MDWGFDLTRTVDDSSTEFAQEGWTIIDDDEAHVVASQREAYQAAQNAFPPLLQHVVGQDHAVVQVAVCTQVVVGALVLDACGIDDLEDQKPSEICSMHHHLGCGSPKAFAVLCGPFRAGAGLPSRG